jgi:pyruvate dehydrogenase E1 component
MEGLQHQDGHSHLLASTIPTLLTYDAAFAYEIAIIVKDGLRRLYSEGEEYFYYLTLYNESYEMPPMPAGAEEGILKGLYKLKPATKVRKFKAHLFGSGPLLREALAAQEILAEQFDVSADVWSATSYKLLRGDALRTRRWNMLHPTATRRNRIESFSRRRRRVHCGIRLYEDGRRSDHALGAGWTVDVGHRRVRPQRHAREPAPLFRGRC